MRSILGVSISRIIYNNGNVANLYKHLLYLSHCMSLYLNVVHVALTHTY